MPNNNNIINMLENKNNNYYDAILEYEIKRQASFEWDEPSSSTPNLLVIRNFLINLSEKTENKMDIIESFEDFLKKGTKWAKLTTKEIMELFVGSKEESDGDELDFLSKSCETNKIGKISCDFKYHSFMEFYDPKGDRENEEEEEDDYYSDNYKINGLFFHIGNYSHNVLLSIGVLDLLDKLIDTEYNPDAEIYINAFKSCEINDYQKMNINKIIKSNIGGNKTSLKVMKLLQLIFNDKNREEYKRIIMIDDVVFKQYVNYISKFE